MMLRTMESRKIENGEYLYAVISFKSDNSVELVPLSWVFEKEGKCFCYFPPADEYNKVGEWTASCASPEKQCWESFIVTVLSRTKTLEKRKNRLTRAYGTKNIKSTEDEGQLQLQVQPAVLSRGAVKHCLKNVSSMPASKKRKKIEFEVEDDLSISPGHTSDGHHRMPAKTPNNPVAVRHHGIDEINTAGTVTEKYIDDKFNELITSFETSLTNMKRSLQYDFEAKVLEIKNTIIANANNASTLSLNITDAKAGIGVALPIDRLETFQEFDRSLAGEEKKKALMSLYRVLICGENNSKSCVAKIMPATITKSVELNYSGTGRKINGRGKLNFSKTNVYNCLQDSIVEKFGDSEECKLLKGKVGKWLSGAGDRDGGRKVREKPAREQENSD